MSSDRTTTRLLALAAPLMVKALHYAFAAMADTMCDAHNS